MKMICLSLKILNLSRRFNFPFPICVGLKTFLVDLLQSPVHAFFQKKNRNVDGTIMYASLDHTKVGFLRVKFDLYLVEEGKQHMFLPVLERIVSFLGNDQRLSPNMRKMCVPSSLWLESHPRWMQIQEVLGKTSKPDESKSKQSVRNYAEVMSSKRGASRDLNAQKIKMNKSSFWVRKKKKNTEVMGMSFNDFCGVLGCLLHCPWMEVRPALEEYFQSKIVLNPFMDHKAFGEIRRQLL